LIPVVPVVDETSIVPPLPEETSADPIVPVVDPVVQDAESIKENDGKRKASPTEEEGAGSEAKKLCEEKSVDTSASASSDSTKDPEAPTGSKDPENSTGCETTTVPGTSNDTESKVGDESSSVHVEHERSDPKQETEGTSSTGKV